MEPARKTLMDYQSGPLAHLFPHSSRTDSILQMLAGLRPKLLAVMHGASFRGDGERALRALGTMYAATLGEGRRGNNGKSL